MFDTIITNGIDFPVFLILSAVSLVLGGAAAVLYSRSYQCSRSFLVTLAILPITVQTVIVLVNGNLGTGVAVAGAFGLVRFRSASGTASEISAILLAMVIGLATGMGYLLLAVVYFVIISAVLLLIGAAKLDRGKERKLVITIPENLDYDGLFDDILEKYTSRSELQQVKTSNFGTLYELQYQIQLKGESVPKAFLDEIRCRNGNLNITCGKITEKNML